MTDPARLDAAVRSWTDEKTRKWASTYAASPWGNTSENDELDVLCSRIRGAYWFGMIPKQPK